MNCPYLLETWKQSTQIEMEWRAQRLIQDNYAIAQLDFQLTPNSLLPNQQFNLSGDRSSSGT
jgi:hypothetical protein